MIHQIGSHRCVGVAWKRNASRARASSSFRKSMRSVVTDRQDAGANRMRIKDTRFHASVHPRGKSRFRFLWSAEDAGDSNARTRVEKNSANVGARRRDQRCDPAILMNRPSAAPGAAHG